MFVLDQFTRITAFTAILLACCTSALAAPPAGVNDSVSAVLNTTLSLRVEDLLANDSDPDGDTLEIAFIDDSINGLARYDSAEGIITFTPRRDFVGQAQFTYLLSDGYIGPNYENIGFAMVFIDIRNAPENTPPIANADRFSTERGDPINIYFSDVLANDTDTDVGDELSVVGVSPAENGKTELDTALELIVYTPNPEFNGNDTFAYVVSDGNDQSEAEVTVSVSDNTTPNSPPVANDDRLQGFVDTPLQISIAQLLENDSDADGDTLNIVLVDDWRNGRAELDTETATVTFTPESGFIGTADFTYTVTDGGPEDDRDAATVSIDVQASYQPSVPQANDDEVETPINTVVDITFDALLANDSDPQGNDLTIIEVANASGGIALLNSDERVIRFNPAADFQGMASFSYVASNGETSATARVSVDVIPYYSVRVNNGSGDGDYREGSTVNIIADTRSSDEEFISWTGDVETIDDVNAANTTLLVSNTDITVSANFTTSEVDEEAPTRPTALSANAITATSVSVNWQASTDNVGVNQYLVQIDDREIRVDAAPAQLSGLRASTNYSVRVIAVDAAGNRSERSSRLRFRSAEANRNESTYFFGHSLIFHTFTDYPRTSELSVPYWMHLLGQNAGRNFRADGEFRTANYALPASQAWGFTPDISAWQGDFASSDYDSVVYTELNYVQYQSPSTPHFGASNPNDNPVNAVLRALDYAQAQEPGITFYLYECWPDAGAFAPNYDPASGSNIAPSAAQVANYYAFAQGEYHDWWLQLHDEVQAQRQDARVKMVPIGPILAKLLSTANIGRLNEIPFTQLYEDNAPHGRPSIYFLAALIQYMAMFEERAPANFEAPSVINREIRDNYGEIVDFIWTELGSFNDAQGNSRVW